MSIIKHVTLQKIVAHDFRYDPRSIQTMMRICVIRLTMYCYRILFIGDSTKSFNPGFVQMPSNSKIGVWPTQRELTALSIKE